MKRKVSAKNIGILFIANQVLAVLMGFSWAYLWKWETLLTIAGIDFLFNLPLLSACSDALRQELGLKSPAQIFGNWGRKTFGRSIPVKAGSKETNIFMQTLGLPSGNQAEIVELETITVWHNDNSHTITMPNLEEFLYVAWLRQTQSKKPFSRTYWTRERRRRMTMLDYNIMMVALASCNGLVIDRSEGRSGKLSLSPSDAIVKIKDIY